MNTRTMRREVYEAHEMMRRSQIRRRCQNALISKLRMAGIIAILIIIIVAVTVNAVTYFFYEDIVAQSKTVAYVVEDNMAKMPELPVSDGEITLSTSLLLNDSKPEEENPEYINEPAQVETPAPVVEYTVEILGTPDDHGYQYTEEDYKYLLMVIVGESQNCSKKHQMYVGSVVLNRLHSEKYFQYAHSIKDVALAEGQYACFNDGNAYKTPTDLNIEVAKELIAGGSILPANVIFQAEFKQGDGVYEKIGNTYFCYKD